MARLGCKVVAGDPRHIETAKIADERLTVRPQSDAWPLFALVRSVIEDRMVRLCH